LDSKRIWVEFDLSGSRGVINHVTIRFLIAWSSTICGLLGHSLCFYNRFWDIQWRCDALVDRNL